MTLECKTAMVVEDDVMLRTTVTRHLEDVGLDVVEAGSGDEALAKLEDGHPVDLLFTDVLMPGNIDGLHLAQDVLARWPETKVIIASAMDIPATRIPDKAAFLPKPYRVHDVDNILRHVCVV